MRSTSLLSALGPALAISLAGCGGGSSGGTPGGTGPTAGGLQDSTPYSSAAAASLDGAEESAAVTTHTVTVGGAAITYTATAGHLTALAPGSGAAEATMFYVAYTVANAAGQNRPVLYFYNGGPGSASVWLHLGSFAPRRLVTNDPSTVVPQPFQLVDNAESLIDVADLVFVDAVGTGYSEAIAPASNQTFWSVDADAALMRDFIARYAAVNQRGNAPSYLFGESYGTTRSAVLAELMVAAGMRLDGVILQSSVLDYNSNCDFFDPATVSCEGSLPTYGMVGDWFSLVTPAQADADAYAAQLRSFATSPYGPAAQAWVRSRTAPAPALLDQLVALTGAPRTAWAANVDLDATTFRSRLLPGQLLGRYDARINAVLGSALANSGDPSSAAITPAFTAAANSLFRNELQYSATAGYTLLSDAIDTWDFSHDGLDLPDTIPDLAAAMTTDTGLRTLSLAGYHDLATPFHQTELDLARLGAQTRLTEHVYPGGHMIYLDDTSRPRMKADLVAFLAAGPGASARGRGPIAAASIAPAPARAAIAAAAAPALPSQTLGRGALAQGGDPFLPASLRHVAPAASPRGAALEALVAKKIAERNADPYR